MELTKKYIKSVLHFDDYFWNNDDDVEIVNIIRTRKNIGFYVIWNVVDHNTGYIWNKKQSYVSNNDILQRFDIDNLLLSKKINIRKRKLELLKLKSELRIEM
jgi:hypothetical protein